MNMWRAAMLLVVSMLGSGCATLWTVFEVAHVDWDQGRFTDKVEPLGPVESKVRVSGKYQPPPPAPVAEPARLGEEPPVVVEGPVVVAPFPQPQQVQVGRPLPLGGVAFACSTESRNTLERRHDTLYRYDGVWRVLAVFMFLSEGAMSGLMLATSLKQKDPQYGIFGIGLYMALDALGTLALAFHPAQKIQRVTEGEGRWVTKAECPQGLGVDTETGTFRVEPDGHVQNLEPWLLQRLVETPVASVGLSLGDQHVPYAPSMGERCTWSWWAQSPAPFCSGGYGVLSPAEVQFRSSQ